MRLTLALLFAGILLAIPAVVLADAVFERESQGETAAYHVGTPFTWPEHPKAATPEVALRVLAEAATATGSNVLRTTVNTPRSGQKRIRHYVFVGRDHTALFDGFTLAAGRWPSPAESRDGTVTVSSARAGERDNVGVPSVFGDRYELTFAPLRQAFDALPAAGRYVVEAPDAAATGRFLELVRQRLVEAGVEGLTVADLTPAGARVPAESGGYLEVLAYLLAGVATVVIAFVLLREGKRIGVLRLTGFSAVRVWFEVVGRLQLASFAVGLAACGAVSLAVPGVDALLLRTLAGTLARVAVLGFAATVGVGLLVIHRVRISDLIKGSLQ
ncbi:hypothetical protein [Amycolatopsis sp. SID8362]|uniref:hypothetical protein n=1 Tax=Amycolatopsis sp. SID8362 TaxID=2690346 RepID=UPI00136B6BC4|nr:hypothetical protein [Amycolatopsis sp. SID8362]NBH12396.1 hypothetical protein [Amycolatopsis sp. SID8362]NED49088.1 hypothetical protein [Amycolatopsis sp. SID8362]